MAKAGFSAHLLSCLECFEKELSELTCEKHFFAEDKVVSDAGTKPKRVHITKKQSTNF